MFSMKQISYSLRFIQFNNLMNNFKNIELNAEKRALILHPQQILKDTVIEIKIDTTA